MSYTVNVSGISSTTEQQLHDFFSFCGRISKIDLDESGPQKSAIIHFEKPSAAKTALMLNGSLLDGSALTVHSDTVHPDEEESEATHVPGTPLDQSDKPRAGIAAEYLAKGYKLSDGILQRAIHLDAEKGISKRFLNYFQSLDLSIGAKALGPDQTISGKVTSTIQTATQRARTVDEQKGYSKVAGGYYTRALSSPLGQRVRAFYTTTSKQILDIHEEARRITDEHKASQHATEPASAGTPDAVDGSSKEA
jgi:RNA recognition motif-containing protein